MFMASYKFTEHGARARGTLPAPQTPRIAPSPPTPIPVANNVVPFRAKREKLQRVKERTKAMPEWARIITAAVAAERMIAVEHILGRSLAHYVVKARHEVFYRLKTDRRNPSFKQMSLWFGRDHVGVLWGAATHAMLHDLPQVTTIDLARRIERNRAAVKLRDMKARMG